MTPPEPGEILESRYCVRRVLDEGRLGVVVEAEDLASDDGKVSAVFVPAAGGVASAGAALVEGLVSAAAAGGDGTKAHLVGRLLERGGGRYRERLVGMGFDVVMGLGAEAEAPLSPGTFPGLRVALHGGGLTLERYRHGWVSSHEEGWLADPVVTVEAARLPWELDAFEALVRALAAAARYLAA